MPNASKHGARKVHPTDASQNFGTFLGPEQDIYLKVVDCGDQTGFEGKKLGRGVITTVPNHNVCMNDMI
jgi:hypothetical protein